MKRRIRLPYMYRLIALLYPPGNLQAQRTQWNSLKSHSWLSVLNSSMMNHSLKNYSWNLAYMCHQTELLSLPGNPPALKPELNRSVMNSLMTSRSLLSEPNSWTAYTYHQIAPLYPPGNSPELEHM
jgi:hypothetical protein